MRKTIRKRALLWVLGMVITAGCAGGAGLGDPQPATGSSPLLRSDGAISKGCTLVTSSHDVVVPRIRLTGSFLVNGAPPLPYDSERGRIELRSPTLGVVDLGSIHAGSYARYLIPGVYDVVYQHLQGEVVPQNAETILQEGVALTATGTLDIAIPSVLVMGTITVGGAPAPASAYEWGEIRLRDRKTGAVFKVGSSYQGSFMAMVIPGLYDVLWSRKSGGSTVPANTASVLLEEVTVAGLTELDVDVPAALRTGQFRLNGAAPPAGFYENATISLRDNRTGDVFPLGQTRDQTYAKVIVPGTYDVLYSRLLGSSIVPRNARAVIAKDVVLGGAGALDIDIPSVTLQGTLSLDGGDFPGGAYDRARFSLRGTEEGDLFVIAESTPRTYQVQVIPGTYDIVYERLLSTGLVPENPWAVVSGPHQVLKGKGSNPPPVALDLAVWSGWLGADVSVWGQPPLGSVYQNGQIRAQGDTGPSVLLGTTATGGGSARLLAGSYELRYAHLIGNQVPANGDATVGSGTSSPFLVPAALDLHPGTLVGGFSQGGQPFPLDPAESAVISLRDVHTGDQVTLGATSTGGYQKVLLGGSYEVVYDQVAGDDVVANRGAKLGCVSFQPSPPLGLSL